jgi:hypothetical protein
MSNCNFCKGYGIAKRMGTEDWFPVTEDLEMSMEMGNSAIGSYYLDSCKYCGSKSVWYETLKKEIYDKKSRKFAKI